MNRNNEYNEFMQGLENTPLKLDFTMERARARMAVRNKRRRVKKAIFVPLGTIAVVFVMFASLVNFSAPFAEACSKIPLLDRLAEAVSLSPSLRAAVENDYMQEIGLERTKNGVTARIEYVIVDQKQLNIFYSLTSDGYSEMEVRDVDTNLNEGYFMSCSHVPQIEDGSLRDIVLEFSDGYAMPDSLDLTIKVYDAEGTYESNMVEGVSDAIPEYESRSPEYITEFDFTLKFDPSYTASGEVYDVENSFEIDGQALTLETAEVYPTHTRLKLSAADDNTAWLTGLDFYIEDEKGKRFDSVSNGVSAIGEADSPMFSTYMMESSYFCDCEHLTLYITGAKWLKKGMERMHVNMAEGTADNLPDGVALEYVKEFTNGWYLFFSLPKDARNYELIGSNSYDADGKHYLLGEQCTTDGGLYYECAGMAIGSEDDVVEQITIFKDEYPYDEVWISAIFTDRTEFEIPIPVKIK